MRTQICRSTLLSLVQAVQDRTASDEEAVAMISRMLNAGRVVLIGTFAAERIAEAEESEFGLERICAA
jgi:hypothetical protein